MSASPSFEKLAEYHYRNPASWTYFARVKLRGKEIKQTLETKNLATARRKLKDFKAKLDRTDTQPGRITLKEPADKFEKTIRHFVRDTITNSSDPRRILRLGGGAASGQLASPFHRNLTPSACSRVSRVLVAGPPDSSITV